MYDPDTEKQLDEWVELKRQKLYKTADAMHNYLKARGVEPEQARPGLMLLRQELS